MKKRISLLICAVMLFVTIFSVFGVSASENTSSSITTVYVSEPSAAPAEIPKELVYGDLPTAISALTDGGTVYICGEVPMPISIETARSENAMTYIKGYPGTNARIVFPVSGAEIKRDLTFDNIIIKGASKDESWTRAVGASLTFASGCTYEPSDPYVYGNNNNATSGIYIGHSKKYEGDSHYVLSSPAIEYTMISPVGCYSSGYDVNGHFTFDLNDGIYKSIYGGVRNGNNVTSFQRLYGDVTYNINGGQLFNLYSHNHIGGNIYGNIVFNVNGGQYSSASKFALGNCTTVYMSNTLESGTYSRSGNLAIIINSDELEKNNSNISALKITEVASFAKITKGETFIVINHAEKKGYAPQITATNVDYLLKVENGKAVPMFESSDNSGYIGEFLGFEITSEKRGYVPYMDGKKLEKNSDGYYTIPKSSSFKTVLFKNPLEGQYFEVTFTNPENSSEKFSETVEGNNVLVLPVCEFESEKCFVGWEYDGKRYASGEDFVVDKKCTLKAVWQESSTIESVYVNGDTGDDRSSGASRYAPVKTLYQAIVNADEYGATKIVVMSAIESGNVNFTNSNVTLTITGRDDEVDYGGSLLFTSSQSLKRPVIFEHMALGSKIYQFICTGSNKVIFGDGLREIEGNGISAHLGNE